MPPSALQHTYTHSTRAAGQNRALIVLEETNLTLVSEVMSSSAKQQRFFIALLYSLCASVSLFVDAFYFSLLLTVQLYCCFSFFCFTKITDKTVISLHNSWRAYKHNSMLIAKERFYNNFYAYTF